MASLKKIIAFFLLSLIAANANAQFISQPFPAGLVVKQNGVVVNGGGRTINFSGDSVVTFDSVTGYTVPITEGTSNVLAFPESGNTKICGNYSELTTGNTHTLYSSPVGTSGLVRYINFITQVMDSNNSYTQNLIFNIKYDGESSPSVSIPVVDLIGYETGNLLPNVSFNTPLFSIDSPGISQFAGGGATSTKNLQFTLRYPIPYTNGINIYLSTSGTTDNLLWTNVAYQDSLANSWNQNLRFFATRSNEAIPAGTAPSGTIKISSTGAVTGSGTSFTQSYVGKFFNNVDDADRELEIVSVTNSTTAQVDPAGVANIDHAHFSGFTLDPGHTFLTRAAGKSGWVVTVFGGMAPTTVDFGYLEGNVRFRVNQETYVSLEWTGTEDFFNGCFYFQYKRFQDFHGGPVCWDYGVTDKVTAYREFYDHPIRYTNGITGIWPNLSGDIIQANWTTIYYEEQ